MRALGSFVVLAVVVSCLVLVEAKNEHKPAADAKAGGLNLASNGSIAQQSSASASDSDSHASIHTSTLRRVVRHLRKLNEDGENDSQEEEADQDEQSQDEQSEQSQDEDNEEQQGSYSVQGEYKNDYQGYQSQYKTSGRSSSSSSSSTTGDASDDSMSWDNSIGGGIAVWSLSAVAISLYALVGIRSFYRRYGDRDIYTGAGVPGGSRNSLAGMDDNANDKKVNLILPSGKELECENTVVSAMTGYPTPL